jgi:hypothetical protein
MLPPRLASNAATKAEIDKGISGRARPSTSTARSIRFSTAMLGNHRTLPRREPRTLTTALDRYLNVLLPKQDFRPELLSADDRCRDHHRSRLVSSEVVGGTT